MEIIWTVMAALVGAVLYKFFTGHGGIKVSRAALAGLPAQGALVSSGTEVRWSTAADDAVAAAWPLPSGHWVAIRVTFDLDPDREADVDPDQGHMDLTIAERQIVSGAESTDRILDRSLRADVETVLKALAKAAKQARSDSTRAATAKPVGRHKELE